jgi:hypothetical protein
MRFLAMRRAAAAVLLATGIAGGLVGCNDPFAPQVPSPANKTDTFSGSFGQGGSVVHSFPVSAYGPITITMTSVGPLASMGLGVSLGLWDGSNCGAALITNVNGKAGTDVLTGNVQAANYCIVVYDSGNVPPDWTVTYSLEVKHP